MSTHGSGEPAIRLFLGACVVFTAACGDEGATPDGGACQTGEPAIAAASQAPTQGSMRVQERLFIRPVDGVATEQAQTIISGRFQRVVETSTPASITPLGARCVGLISAPILGEFDRLDAGVVRVVVGPNGEDVPAVDAGYRLVVPGARWLSEADEVSVQGGGSGSQFPAFAAELTAPDPLQLSSPATDGSARLMAGDALEFRWTPGNGDIVLVDISPLPPSNDGGKVQCIFADDGCGVVPAAATIFLRSNNVENFQVVVSRLVDERVALDDETTFDFTLQSTVDFQVPPGDGL